MKSHPLHIGMVTWDFDPPKGGLGRALKEMRTALVSLGHDVQVLAPSGGTETAGAWTKRFGGHVAFSFALLPSLQRWIDRTGRRILLVPCGPGGIFLLRKPKRCRTVAIVYHTYAQQSRCVPGQWWKRLFLPLERALLRYADHVLCYCRDTQEVLWRDYRLETAKVSLLPQIADLRPWLAAGGPKEENLCVCVARLEQRKGIPFLLKVWSCVQERCPRARLMLVGDGVQAARIDRWIRRKDLSVERISSLRREEIIALVSKSQLLLCPSFLEGFGLSALEAMAAGTLVLASDRDGLRSLLRHGRTGVLLAPRNVSAWSEAIVSFLASPQKGLWMTERAREDVRERFAGPKSISALQERLESLYSGG